MWLRSVVMSEKETMVVPTGSSHGVYRVCSSRSREQQPQGNRICTANSRMAMGREGEGRRRVRRQERTAEAWKEGWLVVDTQGGANKLWAEGVRREEAAVRVWRDCVPALRVVDFRFWAAACALTGNHWERGRANVVPFGRAGRPTSPFGAVPTCLGVGCTGASVSPTSLSALQPMPQRHPRPRPRPLLSPRGSCSLRRYAPGLQLPQDPPRPSDAAPDSQLDGTEIPGPPIKPDKI